MHNLSFHEHGELCCGDMVEMQETQSESKPWYDFTHADMGVDHLEDFHHSSDFSFDLVKITNINSIVLFKDYFVVEPDDVQCNFYEEPDWHSQYYSSSARLRGPPVLA